MSRLHHLKIPSTTGDSKHHSSATGRNSNDNEQDLESSGDLLTTPLPPSAFLKQQQHPSSLSQALLDKTAKDRKALLVYLKSMFLGRGLWLGICRIPLREIGRFYRSSLSAASSSASAVLSPSPSSPPPIPSSSMTARVSGLFSLGVGVGTLLRSATPVEFAKALNMLLL